VLAEVLEGGPFVLVTVPKTEFARTWGVRVPSPQEDIDMVIVVPEDALGEKLQPEAVPVFEKSAAATVFTFCEKVKVYEISELVLVGVDWAEVNEETVGALR
jgi:hypothetical protein